MNESAMTIGYCRRFILTLPETAHFSPFIEKRELVMLMKYLSLSSMVVALDPMLNELKRTEHADHESYNFSLEFNEVLKILYS